jgi:transcriptional regulator with XRE-family HTH domain
MAEVDKRNKADTHTSGRRRRTIREHGPDPVDVHVGRRLRQARFLAGMSQEELGEGIGVSFQAVQKYENGENRLSAGRLAAAAKFLGVPMSFFFQDDTEPQTAGDTAGFTSKEIELVRHYRAIRGDDMREHLLRLTKIISEQNLSGR